MIAGRELGEGLIMAAALIKREERPSDTQALVDGFNTLSEDDVRRLAKGETANG